MIIQFEMTSEAHSENYKYLFHENFIHVPMSDKLNRNHGMIESFFFFLKFHQQLVNPHILRVRDNFFTE